MAHDGDNGVAIVALPAPGLLGRIAPRHRSWLARADFAQESPSKPLYAAILGELGRPLPDAGLGALRLWGQTGERPTTWIAAADPVYLEPRVGSLCLHALGPAAVSESYLKIDRIIEAARSTGAQAIHPGYGLLSENVHFAEASEAAGLKFIGPTPANIREFGLKHTARDLAQRSGVALLPGTGLLADEEQAGAEASRIGYPVILKSTAGGGGIGMRICGDEKEVRDAFASVQRLSQSPEAGGAERARQELARLVAEAARERPRLKPDRH